jgi:hypothetical protein
MDLVVQLWISKYAFHFFFPVKENELSIIIILSLIWVSLESCVTRWNFIFPGATDTIASYAKSPKRKCAKNGRAKNAMDTESLTRKRKYGTVVKKDRYEKGIRIEYH